MGLRIRNGFFKVSNGIFTSKEAAITAFSAIGQVYRIINNGGASESFTYTKIDGSSASTGTITSGSIVYVLALSGSLSDSTYPTNGTSNLTITNLLITSSIQETPSFTEQIITTTGPGSWIKPEGVTQVVVECWGGGGGGGNSSINDSGAGGGGGGGYARSAITYSSAQQSISYTVGNGGVANGQDTIWNVDLIIARGGQGGEDALGPDQTALGGPGGGFVPEISALLPNIGDITYVGGDGANGWALNVLSPAIAYSAGGGAAGSTASGSSADPNADPPLGGLGASEFGGNGGTGTLGANNFIGVNGNNYGGGGSGAQKISGPNRLGGDGAQGLIRLIYR